MGPIVSAWFLRRWLSVGGFAALIVAFPLIFLSLGAARVFLVIGFVLIVANLVVTLSKVVRVLFGKRKVESDP